MRSEKEMMALILQTALNHKGILGVYMNGSRTNPNAPKDDYQDYDVVFVVEETAPFVHNPQWLAVFGKTLITQEPDLMDFIGDRHQKEPFDPSLSYTWLMLFEDGNRIDLRIETIKKSEKNILKEKLTLILLDKEGVFPKLSSPTDEDYHIIKPVEGEYRVCCNEFWWCLNNVAKGIAREEISYAMGMLNQVVREALHTMMDWYIGSEKGFSISTGKMGKYYQKYLPEHLYKTYCKTYPQGNTQGLWESLWLMCDLFSLMGKKVGEDLGFIYQQKEEEGARKYIKWVVKKTKQKKIKE